MGITVEEAKELIKEAMAPPFLRIKFSYSMEIILPYLKGIELLTLLAEAEKYDSDYRRPKIESLSDEDISMSILSSKDRDIIKMSMLLNIDVQDIKGNKTPF